MVYQCLETRPRDHTFTSEHSHINTFLFMILLLTTLRLDTLINGRAIIAHLKVCFPHLDNPTL